MSDYDDRQKREEKVNDLVNKLAKNLAKGLPDELMVEVLAHRFEEALAALAKGGYGGTDLGRMVQQAVETRAMELLKTKYADQVNELADKFAHEALVIAKNEVSAKRKKQERY